MSDYSIWLVECGNVRQFPIGAIYGGRFNAGTISIPFGYVVLSGEGHLAVVDTGYDYDGHGKRLADATPVVGWRGPADILGPLGLDPRSVDTVLLTHAHWDHAGNVAAFPNASVYLQARELDEWRRLLGAPGRRDWLLSAIDPADFEEFARLELQGRLILVDGDLPGVLPGVDLIAAHDTHTPGHQVVAINTAKGTYVAAGDCVMAAGNLAGDGRGGHTPIGNLFGSALQLFELYDEMLTLVGGDPGRVLAVHDAGTWQRYPTSKRNGLHVATVNQARPLVSSGPVPAEIGAEGARPGVGKPAADRQ